MKPIEKINDIVGLIIMYQPRTHRGDYIDQSLMLWQKADPSNKKLLQPYMSSTIEKYGLEKIAEQYRNRLKEIKS